MVIPTKIEICQLVDVRRMAEITADCKRVYFGHETCEKLLPAFDEVQDLLEMTAKRQLKLSFVTPFLTERGMDKVILFLEKLKTMKLNSFEIVSSDWGLIHYVINNKAGTPVVGRFLAGQQVDFRLMEQVHESKEQIVCLDGCYHQLAQRKMPPALVEHISSATLLKNKTLEMLRRAGVVRFELSNVIQPIVLPDFPSCRYSLHLPFVPLAIFRTCPESADFNKPRKDCSAYNCNHNRQRWQYDAKKRDLYCIDNALYYYHPDVDAHLQQHRLIDRIVIHSRAPDIV